MDMKRLLIDIVRTEKPSIIEKYLLELYRNNTLYNSEYHYPDLLYSDSEYTEIYGMTPLLMAVLKNNLHILKIMICDYNFDVRIPTYKYYDSTDEFKLKFFNLFGMAIARQEVSIDTIKLLIDNGGYDYKSDKNTFIEVLRNTLETSEYIGLDSVNYISDSNARYKAILILMLKFEEREGNKDW
jgi:hypothetical protein